MGLFKKKEKEKTANRVIVIIIELLIALLLFFSLLCVKWAITNSNADDNIIKLENQVVDNVSFVDFVIEYSDEGTNLSVSAINYTDETIEFSNLKIRLYAENNSLISQIEVPDTVVLETSQEHLITHPIVGTIDKVASVEYIIE